MPIKPVPSEGERVEDADRPSSFMSGSMTSQVAGRQLPGRPVAGDPTERLAILEAAFDRERDARRAAERRLRAMLGRADDDLGAALDACRQLELEKLAAFDIDGCDDAAIFHAADPARIAEFSWTGLRARLDAAQRSERDRYETQIRDLTERLSQELRLAEQRRGLAEQRTELAEQRAGLAELRADDLRAVEARRTEALGQVEADRATLRQEADALTARLATLDSDLQGARNELAVTRRRLDDVYSSTSWKASRPLRALAHMLGRGR